MAANLADGGKCCTYGCKMVCAGGMPESEAASMRNAVGSEARDSNGSIARSWSIPRL